MTLGIGDPRLRMIYQESSMSSGNISLFRIGAHDGYYGQAVANAFYMLSTLAVPSLMNYFRAKVRLIL